MKPRMYCKTCDEFKELRYGGKRIKSGWICNLCFLMLNKKKGLNNAKLVSK